MKALKLALPFAFLVATGARSAQSQDYTAGAQIPSQRVIIPWTHFGQDATPADPPPQAVAKQPPSVLSPKEASVDGSALSDGTQRAQPSSGGSSPNLYEADISKKHPHPPEPVDLPVADQDTAPSLNVLPSMPGSQSALPPAGGKPAHGVGVGEQKAQDNSSEAQIAALTAGYKQREASRNAQRAQLLATSTNDPATRALAQIEATRLLLENENDRSVTSQQLARAFASLGEQLDTRAHAVQDLIESRNQGAVTAEADLKQLNGSLPQRELALRNLAMLPATDQNDRIIRGLNAELTQEENARELDEETSKEALSEIQALKAEADELEQAAAEARRKSTTFANAAQAAKVNERLLADRLEYSVARMRGTDLLTSASKALDQSGALGGNAQLDPLSATRAVPALGSSANQATDQLRDCIRKTGNPDACRAKQDQ
jgi:hypothetical protein